MIISVLNLKGGAGKTTLATNLAVWFSKKQSILLIDADEQRSSMLWSDARKADKNLNVVSITEPNNLKKQIPSLHGKYDHLIIDGAPHADTSNAVCIFCSDIIIVPMTPSPLDLWATQDFLERVAKAKEMQKNVQVILVLNRYNTQSTLAKDTAEAVAALDLHLAETKMHNRVAYAETILAGQSVIEGKNKAAKEEFEALAKEIEKFIK